MIYIWMILILLFSSATYSYSWQDNKTTHNLTTKATLPLVFQAAELESAVGNKTQEDWILEGVDLEDQGTKPEFITGKARSLNHFHAPTKPLASAGLSDLILPYLYGESALAWAQDGATQSTKAGGDWSWQRVRSLYYTYLTTSDKNLREAVQSDYLKGLGYQLHSIQDMSQPNHVRNDTHIADGDGNKKKYGFETWAATNKAFIENILNTVPIPNVTVDLTKPFADTSAAPIPVARLFDTREHLTAGVISPSAAMDQGLAEFTNTNFYSEDTTFADGLSTSNVKYFPYPAKSETNLQSYIDNTLGVAPVTDSDGSSASYFKISKQNTSGVPLSCLAKAGPNSKKYYAEFGEGAAFYKSFRVDDECFKEYSQHLFPRAVAYSKAVLDYFFRGTIELTLPAQGIYSISAPNSAGYTGIRVKAKNSTISKEKMTSGSLQLVVKYKLATTDPFLSAPVDVGPEQYIVVPEKNGKTTLDVDNFTELEFDLSASPTDLKSIPFWATNVTMQVIYKGQLGNETGAVAVGMKDISEPTPIDIVNNMDLVCLNSTIMIADSPEAIAVVGANANGNANWDVYRHGLTNVYLSFNGALASPSNYSATFANIPPGNYGRVFVLADYSAGTPALQVGKAVTVQKLNAKDLWTLSFGSSVDGIDALRNQSGHPTMYYMRGLNSWWYTQYNNPVYPAGSTCDFTTASPNTAGPVVVTIP